MPKRIALVGHCGPDNSYLRLAILNAVRGAEVVSLDEQKDLDAILAKGVDLILFNRQLDYGFDADEGVELIKRLRASHPMLRMMLISNFAEAQQQAVAAGALPGFGKREIGSKRATELLRDALPD